MGDAVVLLSGGIDSSTTLAVALKDGFRCHALTVDYGQRHAVELNAASRIARALGAYEHRVVKVDLRKIGGSALTDDIAVPSGRTETEIAGGIPVTYVPARNTILLAIALGWAEVLSARDIYIGVTAVDYSGYPDCRRKFIKAFEHLASVATKAGVEGVGFKIHTPLISLSKAEIIRLGMELAVDYSLTHSCYAPDRQGRACGRCDSCVLRKRGFERAGVRDPAVYSRPDSAE